MTVTGLSSNLPVLWSDRLKPVEPIRRDSAGPAGMLPAPSPETGEARGYAPPTELGRPPASPPVAGLRATRRDRPPLADSNAAVDDPPSDANDKGRHAEVRAARAFLTEAQETEALSRGFAPSATWRRALTTYQRNQAGPGPAPQLLDLVIK